MRKELFVLMLSFCIITTGRGQLKNRFVLQGDVRACTTRLAQVQITYMINGKFVTDSAKVTDGRYLLTGTTYGPLIAYLMAVPAVALSETEKKKSMQAYYLSVFLEPGDISITSTEVFSGAAVKGSSSHPVFVKLEQTLRPYRDRVMGIFERLNAARLANDSLLVLKEEEAMNAGMDSISYVQWQHVRLYPSSPLNIYLLQELIGTPYEDSLPPYFEKIRRHSRQVFEVTQIEKQLSLRPGIMAPDFTLNDTALQAVQLSSFRGTYVLVDFWASWCEPCRKENPYLVKAYEQYADRGFRIFSVSLDFPSGKKAWLDAIRKDQLTRWTHASDLMGWESPVAKLYNISSIPSNLLLDPSGKIIAKNLRGAAVLNKLKALLDSTPKQL